MNREIKFRFWNTVTQQFENTEMYAIDGNGNLIAYDFETCAYDQPVRLSKTCIIPQQWTGYQDSHGRDIYVGDLIEHDVNKRYKVFEYEELRRLGELPQTNVFVDEIKSISHYVCGNYTNAVIIGNIFENPDIKMQSDNGVCIKTKNYSK